MSGTPVPVVGVAAFGIGAGQLVRPEAVALDGNGDLFVTDGLADKVMEYPYHQSIASYAKVGVPVAGVGGSGRGASQLSSPGQVALDALGDLFVADSGNSRVQEFSPLPKGGYSPTGATVATVAGGVALDPAGDLFVSDPARSRVEEHRLNPGTGRYAGAGITVAGRAGAGRGLDQLTLPTSVAVDQSGRLFVFDGGSARVMEYTGNPATGSYGPEGAVAYQEAPDYWSEQGAVALDGNGNLLFDNNLTKATVFEVTAPKPVTVVTPPVSPPVTSPGQPALDKVIADITQPNAGHPHGVPASYSFYAGPELDNPRPGPDMTAATGWGVIFEASEGSPATNTRVEVRNEQLHLGSNSRQAWIVVQQSVGPTGSDFTEPSGNLVFANQSFPADLRTEADGGISVRMSEGAWFHFWPSEGRVPIVGSDIGGVFTTFQARLVTNDPKRANDTASARYLAAAGADWWATMDAPWPKNSQVFYDRFSYLSSAWQSFSGASWSPAQIRQNPPNLSAMS